MRLVHRGRGGGKTTAAIDAFLGGPNRVLLVVSEQEKQRLIAQYGVSESRADDIIVANTDTRRRLAGRNVISIIDNADIILTQILGCYGIYLMTVNKDAG